ncbi:hypothetical protein [Sediminicola luteus]|uniref:Uncharacterized protein n=1 Tax=Sediminicola luteus TaxID=319238 RepID=A0A2A4G3R3_9FLAO|nr:hypothetical protein [Sediminicola luteus]PCE62402.1 hypothetical protein B7P33_19260 [Sediminicola luteus]
MKNKARKIKEIKNLLDHFSGHNETPGKPEGNHIRLEVADNQDITNHITALLEVCYLALDGKGDFTSPGLKGANVEFGVLKVLEMVLNLIPHGQMHCLDEIQGIIEKGPRDG